MAFVSSVVSYGSRLPSSVPGADSPVSVAASRAERNFAPRAGSVMET
jgi:hypothetical protein